jgi:hypothetical protein
MPSPPESRPKLSAPPKAQQAHADLARKGGLGRLSPAELEEAIQKVREARARLEVEANPLWQMPKDTSSPGHPTQLRKDKEPYGWNTYEQSGGQTAHKPKSILDDPKLAQHFPDVVKKVWKVVEDDAETATRVNLISQRAYTGMPFTGASGERVGHITQRQRDAHSRFAYAKDHTAPGIWTVVEILVLMRRIERLGGRAMTLEEFGRMTSRYSGRDTAVANSVGKLQIALLAVMERYAEWFRLQPRRESWHCLLCDSVSEAPQCPCGAQGTAMRKETYRSSDEREGQRKAFEHGRVVERFAQIAKKTG